MEDYAVQFQGAEMAIRHPLDEIAFQLGLEIRFCYRPQPYFSRKQQ